MCRIAGIYHSNASIAQATQWVQQMCDVQAHGGPDDAGMYVADTTTLVLGHRRLSLIDLSPGGHQPMAWQQRYQIVYNGELYNYQALKKQLQALGCQFHNQSDTEVILAAYANWGTAAFEQFNGMFAFAIWDQQTGQVILARDAAGIKPLYLAITNQGLAFASEVKALQQLPYLQTPHPHWKIYMLAYGHLPEPITTLQDVKPLQKGTYCIYDIATKQTQVGQFKRFQFSASITDHATATQQIAATLTDSVKCQMLADAPVGVFLSGGLDSSIISLLANQQHPDIRTISIWFNEKDYSEKKYQELVQQQMPQATHHDFLLNQSLFEQSFPQVISEMDLPSCDGINTWFISKHARECGLKAVLSGIGGDELLGGYPSFRRIEAANILRMFPDFLLKAGKYAKEKSLRRLGYLSIKGPAGMYLFLRGQFIPQEIASILQCEESQVWSVLSGEPGLPDISHLEVKNQASWIESNLYMQNQLLRDADVMSMAHGIEIRVPFLDNHFIETCLKIKSSLKYQGDFPKQLLIDAFNNLLPTPVWNRPKMGFAFPFKEWLANSEFMQDGFAGANKSYQNKLADGNIHWSQYLTLFLTQKSS